jgi:hypothetical protein
MHQYGEHIRKLLQCRIFRVSMIEEIYIGKEAVPSRYLPRMTMQTAERLLDKSHQGYLSDSPFVRSLTIALVAMESTVTLEDKSQVA